MLELHALEAFLGTAVGWVWNYPVILLCLLGGVFFTLRMGFIQFRCLPHALSLVSGKYDNPNEKGQITHFQALSAALSGTIGLGNIAGVAIAIGMGGPGSILWMWIIGILGMATKFVECSLGTHFRDEDPKTGEVRGGPMYYITKGLGKKWKPLAVFYASMLALGAFGAGSLFQANQSAEAIHYYYGIDHWIIGVILCVLGGLVVLGGIKRIGNVASKIVPAMCFIYVIGAVIICFVNIEKIPFVVQTIINDAFTGSSAAGGVVGTVIIIGVRRAIFSNEAGLGSAPIAHAAVKTDYPIREGFVAALGPLIDTIVVCSATAMVIILSGFYGTEMYQPLYTAPTPYASQNWTITPNKPPSTEKLREFVANKRVLFFNSTFTEESDAIRTAAIPLLTEKKTYADSPSIFSLESNGLRFSYYKNSGDMGIRLLDANQKEVAFLTLDPSGDSLSKMDNTSQRAVSFLKVTNYDMEKQWQSSVIHFGPAFKNIAKNNPELFKHVYLEFVPNGSSVSWYIDRIQTVKKLKGIYLTTVSFDSFFTGFGSIFITFAVFLFAFSTIITWCYYGETGAKYVLGTKVVLPYKLFFVGCAFLGTIIQLDLIISLTDLFVGLLVIPNIIAIILLSPKVVRWTNDYFKKLKSGEIQPYHSDDH